MMRAKLNRDEANLRDYLKDPQAKVKGNRMPFGAKVPHNRSRPRPRPTIEIVTAMEMRRWIV